MIYIHGEWQPEQESGDVIWSQAGEQSKGSDFPPIRRDNSQFQSVEVGAEQSYHGMLPKQNNTWL